MSASYLQFRARMLAIYPLVELAELMGQIHLDIHVRRNAHRRQHYESMAQEATT